MLDQTVDHWIWVMWLIFCLSLATSVWLLWSTRTWCLRFRATLLSECSARSLPELNAEVVSLRLSVASLATSLKRLSAREGMRDLRERRRDQGSSSSSPVTPKEALRQKARQQGLLSDLSDKVTGQRSAGSAIDQTNRHSPGSNGADTD